MVKPPGTIREGQTLNGPMFNEPMLVETVRPNAAAELSLTEVLQRIDDEIGRTQEELDNEVAGAEGRRAQAEPRHAEVLARRESRREELGRQRAAYGANLIEQLARDMTRRFGRGFSRQNLWQMRQFGLAYPPERILQTLSGESARPRPRHSPMCALKTSSRPFRPLASLRAAAVGQESTRPRILRSRGAPRRIVRPPTRSTDQPPRRPREAPARRHAAGRTEVGSVSRCAEILEET